MAKQPMLKFVNVERDMPEKRGADLRREDFHEIYAEFADAKAKEQASRCSQCGVPYCQSHCPLHNNIPDWLRMTATGRLEEAYAISQATNTFQHGKPMVKENISLLCSTPPCHPVPDSRFILATASQALRLKFRYGFHYRKTVSELLP